MIRNDNGMTLAELLAALTILILIIGSITAVTVYSDRGVRSETTKAEIMQESRNIFNLIAKSIRNETSIASKPNANVLDISFMETDAAGIATLTGNYTRFVYAPASGDDSGTLTFVSFRDGVTVSQVLSDNIGHFAVTLSESNRKLEISLEMNLPNNQTYESSTVVYYPRLILN